MEILIQKLKDELVARLAELGDEKIGRTNFYFAARKLKSSRDVARLFTKFTIAKEFRRKRNQEIAHREQAEKWFEDRSIRIPYKTILKALALAIRLMKKIDRLVLGPAAPYLWREGRKKRGDLVAPARAMYLLLPYLRLSPEDRMRVVAEEQAEGKVVWSEMATKVNGEPRQVLVNKEWGLLLLGSRCVALPEYPLQKLESVTFNLPDNEQDA